MTPAAPNGQWPNVIVEGESGTMARTIGNAPIVTSGLLGANGAMHGVDRMPPPDMTRRRRNAG